MDNLVPHVNCGSCISAAGACLGSCQKNLMVSQGISSYITPLGGKPVAADPVKCPSHYRIFDELVGRQSIESWDITELVVSYYKDPVVAGNILQVLQYLFRAPHKGTTQQDLEKAEAFLKRAINRIASLRSSEG